MYTDGQGNVNSTPVSSYNVKHNNFFLRTREGQELEMNTTNLGVGFRVGHEITLVIARKPDHWEYVGILNHNTLASEVWPEPLKRLARLPHAGFLSGWGRFGCFWGLIISCFGGWALSPAAARGVEPGSRAAGAVILAIGILVLFSGVYSLNRLLDMHNKAKAFEREVARILQNLKGYQAQAQAALRAQR